MTRQLTLHKLSVLWAKCAAYLPLWLILGLALLCMGVGWQVLQVRFKAHEDSIPIKQAVLVADTDHCRASISDSLATAEVVEDTLSNILFDCVDTLLADRDTRGHAVSLPHEWRKDSQDPNLLMSGRAVYHLTYDFATVPEGLWGLALPATGGNPAVFVNSKLLGWGGSFETPVARNASRPLLFSIPDGLLQKGVNAIDIYLVSEPAHAGFLDAVLMAPVEMLKDGYQHYYFFRTTAAQIVTLILLIVSMSILVLWLYRRQDVEYGLFALGGLFWSIHTLDHFIVKLPFAGWLWDWMTFTSVGMLSVTSVFFIHRFLQETHVLLERFLWVGAWVLAVLMLLVPQHWFYPLALYVWCPLALLGVLYIVCLAWIRAVQTHSRELYALIAVGGVILLFGLYDQLVGWGMGSLVYGRFLHFGAPFLLLSFTWILLQRFIKSLRAMEDFNVQLLGLNQELEKRVEEKTRRIAQSYETIRLLGQEQVLLHERSRIMRDMHDGIGVYLTSMLRQLERREPVDRVHLREAAHNALNDLRLMIDSLGNASTDLPAMLGMFRTRIAVTLDVCQVELAWQVEELPNLTDFGPERALNLLRILQEAFSNALKHSGATCIHLSAYPVTDEAGNGHIKITIKDNGKGFDPQQGEGNGLKNMHYRAKKIKAEFQLNTDEQGTCIVILLPLTSEIKKSERAATHG
ncbi:MAG: hypothetical protein CR991_04960 [Proteobacteria bacterium]|nr:MAG: hypothetical protein CR991_04960 [Pseudomonadota bacterium]